MEQELQKIIINIRSHSDWPINAKIRYAYLKIGQLVSKDIMFFYTVQNNFIGQGKEELQYDYDLVNEIMNTEDRFDYKVICRNSAEMLKFVLNACGIECEIRRTLDTSQYVTDDGSVTITHYFVVVTGDEGKKYFLTLNPDLPNIKLGRATSHFGNDIRYMHADGSHAYDGDEVPATIMTASELKELDRLIGYINSEDSVGHMYTYTDVLFDSLNAEFGIGGLDNYFNFLASKTDFYKAIVSALNENKKITTPSANTESQTNGTEPLYLDFDYFDIDDGVWNSIQEYILKNFFTEIYSQDIKDQKDLFSKSFVKICKYFSEMQGRIDSLFTEMVEFDYKVKKEDFVSRIANDAVGKVKRVLIKDFMDNGGNPTDWKALNDKSPLIVVNQVAYLLCSIYIFINLKKYLESEKEILMSCDSTIQDLQSRNFADYFIILEDLYITKRYYTDIQVPDLEAHVKRYNKVRKVLSGESGEYIQKNITSLLTQIYTLSGYFVDSEMLVNRVIPTPYISKKLKSSMTRILDIGHTNSFSSIGLAEQTVVIKEILHIILAELDQDENLRIYLPEQEETDDNKKEKTLLEQRVFMSVAFDKESKKPYYLIVIKGVNMPNMITNGNVAILYDFEENKLITGKSLTQIANTYFIIKYDDFLKIEDIEVNSKSDVFMEKEYNERIPDGNNGMGKK